MDILHVVRCICIIVVCTRDVGGDLTISPQNTVVVSNNLTVLHCSTSLSYTNINWNYLGNNALVRSCAVVPAHVGQFNTINSATGQCDLLVNNATAAEATTYTCYDNGVNIPTTATAYLTVLANTPSGSSNVTGFVLQNDAVVMSCSASYYGGSSGVTANQTWSGANCSSSTTTGNTSYVSSSITVSAQPPTLQSCSCTTRFNAPTILPDGSYATNAPTYTSTWSSTSNVLISYCPQVAISTPEGSVFQYTMLHCSANAYPNVTSYTWTAISGGGVPNGQSFNVTSLGNYNVSCTATNYLLGGTSRPCSVTAYEVGTTIASYCPQNVMIDRTSETMFNCSAEASPSVSNYTWTNNTRVIQSGSDSTLSLTAGGNYSLQCTAENNLYGNTGRPCSNISSVLYGSAPVILTTAGDTPVQTTNTTVYTSGTSTTPSSNVTTTMPWYTTAAAAAPTSQSSCDTLCLVLAIVIPIVVVATIALAVILLYPGSKCYYKTLRADRHKDQKYKSQANNGSVDTDDASAGMSRQTDQTATYGMEMNTPVSDRSPQYGAGWTGYEAGQQPVIYADLRAPGEPGVTIDNRIGSRTPVQVDNSEYAAVQRA